MYFFGQVCKKIS